MINIRYQLYCTHKKYFDEINADQDDKDELLSFWMPIDGKEDEIV